MNEAAPLVRTNPFPGLRPFREDEEYLFFGRESQVDAMVDKLAATRFLAVVGTSGSGKSSLVNCGLRPALRQGLMARAGAAWRMAQLRPGTDPIGAAARALAQDGVLFPPDAAQGLPRAEIVETTLRMSKLGLIDMFEQARLEEGVNLLVVVDQFEELFRYRQLETAHGDQHINEDAAAFVNLLLEVKQQKTYPIFVVLTMRSDFLGDCTQFPGLAEAINAGQYLVPRLTRDERRAAIEGPVRVGGAEITPVLLTRLVNDVGDNPDQLSILQHALNRTWARWREEGGHGPLDLTHYEAIGTMASALDQHAEQAYAELGGARREQICELLFKALTDKATNSRGVRRPTNLGDLCALTNSTEAEVSEVIDVFRDPSRSFLMPPAGEALQAKSAIDISHESLMRVWRRLNGWADQEAQAAQAYRRLADAAALHATGAASLWRDPELQLALNWRDNNHPNGSWASRYHAGFASAMDFLRQSSEAREAERTERQQQRQRELEAAREKAEAQVKYARRMRLGAILCGLLAGFAMISGIYAYRLYLSAESQRKEADDRLAEVQITQSRALVKEAEDDKTDPSKNILLALESLPDAKENKSRPFLFAAHKLLSDSIDKLHELTVLGHADPVGSVAVTADGSRIVTLSDDGTARVWDANTGAELLQLKGHEGSVLGVAVTADGSRIVTGSSDATGRVWDAHNGAELLQLKGHDGFIRCVAVTPDGARIVTGSDDKTARVWDAHTGAELLQLKGHDGSVLGVAVTPDGSRIITGSDDKTARVWNAGTGAELLRFKVHDRSVLGVAVTPAGRRIVTLSDDSTARVWDAHNGAELLQLKGNVLGVAVTGDGSRIVTGSNDKTARVWDARTGAELLQLKGHDGSVLGVAVTPDGRRVVTGSGDNTARVWVWDADMRAELLRLGGHTRSIWGVAVTRDGARIVTGSADGTARVWDAHTGAELLQLKGHGGSVLGVAVTPDGKRIITGSSDKTARVWDAHTGAELLQLNGHDGFVFGVAVTPDGSRIVTGSSDKTARVWDAHTGAELLQLKGHEGSVLRLAVTPDGSRIVTGSNDKTARVWDARTGAELLQLKGHDGFVLGVAVTPDGSRIVTSSADKTARVWDASTGAELLRLQGHTLPIWGVAVTRDGGRIVTGSDDSTARVWDANTGAELAQVIGNPGPIRGIAVTPDGSRVVGSVDRTVRVWAVAQLPLVKRDLRIQQERQIVVDQGKAVVPRCLTIEERKSYLLVPKPPDWCIDMEKYPYNTEHWKAWKARRMADAVDPAVAQAFGDFSDRALEQGDFGIALDAAKLGLQFDPEQFWILINRAEAHMFLGHREEAKRDFLSHHGEKLDQGQLQGQWDDFILGDFEARRKEGRDDPLMIEIEQLFKASPPVKTHK